MSQSKGYVTSDFFVKDALSILFLLTGKTWERKEVENLPAEIKDNEYTEAVYYNNRTCLSHYRRRGFDSLESSVTVKEGRIVKYYIYTCKR